MRKILIKFLQYLLWKEYRPEYKVGDKRAIEQWCFDSFGNRGATDYLRIEEMKILRNLARGLDQEHYWKEIGKREQLAFILNDFQKVFQLRSARDAKAAAEEAKKNAKNSDDNNATPKPGTS